MVLIAGLNEDVAEWVAQRTGVGCAADFGPSSAVAVVADDGDEIEMLAGVVFHSYRPAEGTIAATVHAVTARWATPGAVAALLRYPFEELGCSALVVPVLSGDLAARRMLSRFGFRCLDEFAATAHRPAVSKYVIGAREWRHGRFYRPAPQRKVLH